VEQQTVREASERIDALLDDLGQSALPQVMERVEELVACVLSLHATGLARIVETLPPSLVRALANDDVVGNLLVLHDLHPDPVDVRVQRALDQVRPFLGSHAGGVSLSAVSDGVAHLRIEGGGCSSSAVRSAIEDAILVAAPDVVAVDVVEVAQPVLLQIQPFHAGSAT
jgi:Fe-S cluster biogenesis protein NfuA